MRFSANLGFLWKELALPDAVVAAKRAGFDAVEFHWPYDVPEADLLAALRDTGLPALGVNTRRGSDGDTGVAALPGRETEARGYIDEAVDFCARAGCRNVHVMAGTTQGQAGAEAVYQENLRHAVRAAARHGLNVLIEPINQRDMPGYHLSSLDHAAETIAAVGADNLKVMFDCYHTQILHGDLLRRFAAALPLVGHVQIAAVPDRGEPDEGEVCFPWLLQAMAASGWDGYAGAEYRPRSSTDAGLGWMQAYRRDQPGL